MENESRPLNWRDEDNQRDSSRSDSRGRRSFLFALLAAGTATVGAVLAVPLIRFVLFPLLHATSEASWSEVGAVEDFASIAAPVRRVVKIEQVDGWRKNVSEKSVYVMKGGGGQLRVLSSICPHLGCEIGWNAAKGEFLCPCHGGVFSPDGTLVSGPPPRGMDTLQTTVQNGRLMVEYRYFRQLVPTKEVIG